MAILLATARAETNDLVLVPLPREITYHPGECRLAADSHVWVDLSGAGDLLPVAVQVRDAQLIKDELTCAANLLRHACRLGIARIEAPEKKIGNIPAMRRAELAAELEQILDEYQRLWLLRNRPGGLADSVAVFAPLLKCYQAEVRPTPQATPSP